MCYILQGLEAPVRSRLRQVGLLGGAAERTLFARVFEAERLWRLEVANVSRPRLWERQCVVFYKVSRLL